MPDADVEFGVFLEKLGELAAQVPMAGRQLHRDSIGALLGGQPWVNPLLILRGVSFDWRFQVARRKDRVVLLFIRRSGRHDLLLNGRIQCRLDPVPDASENQELRPKDLEFRLIRPPFLIPRPTNEELAQFAGPGATATNTLLLRLRGEILAITHPSAGPKGADIRYSALGRERIQGPRWPLAPFLDLLTELAGWVGQDLMTGSEVAIELPAENPNETEAVNEVWQMVGRLSETYCSLVNHSRLDPARAEAGPLDPPLSSFGVSECEGEVALLLNPRGNFAQPDDDETLQVLLRLRFLEGSPPRVKVVFGPPDFLLAGDLHESFVHAFIEATPLDKLAKDLGITESEAESFVQSQAPKSFIFRAASRRSSNIDTNLLACSGLLKGREVGVLLRGDFRVRYGDQGRTVSAKNIAEIQYAGPLDRDALALDQDDVNYLLRLLVGIHGWNYLLA